MKDRRKALGKKTITTSVWIMILGLGLSTVNWPHLLAQVSGAQTQQNSIVLVDVGTGRQPPELKMEVKAANGFSMAKASLADYTGEFYRVGGRKIYLLRSLEKIAVRYFPERGFSIMSNLEATGQPRGKFLVDYEIPKHGITVLRTSKLESLDELTESIHQLEQTSGVLRAVPVYLHEESGLELIATEQFIVKLAEGASYAELDAINEVMGATVAGRLRGTTDQFILALPGCTPQELLTTCEIYWQDPTIEWAEPDFLGQVVKCDVMPNDPLYDNQWHLQRISTPQAWDTTTGSSQIIIAIIDDGMDLEHEDLCQNLAINDREIPGNDIDDDGNGWIDDYNGWDFFDDDNDPSPADPKDNHGTAVAGVAAAKGNNNLGIAGCAFDCKLMPLKLSKGDYYYSFRAAEVIYYAAGFTENRERWRGADVINISLGFSETNAINDAMEYAVTQGRGGKGCPTFCSVGNKASGYIWYGADTSDFSPGRYVVVFVYYKDPAGIDGDDRVWIADVILPDQAETRERFSSPSMPPGWSAGGDVGFEIVDDPSHAYGTGRYVARSGQIRDSQNSFLLTRSFTLVPGNHFSFKGWISSEKGTDESLSYPPDGDDGDWLLVVFCKEGVEMCNGLYVDAGVPGDRRNIPPEEDEFVVTNVSYPASHADTIAVGASTDFDYRADYSQYGPGLDFIAPSSGGDVRITTTDRTGGAGYNNSGDYDFSFGGTSASAPLAAGVGALMLSKNPDLTASEVRETMRESCEEIGDVTYVDGWNEYYGHGRINAESALDRKPKGPETVITIGTGTSDWEYPIHTYFHDSRTQVIYLANEIGTNGTITALALDVVKPSGQPMNNWTIRMKHTSMSEYNTCSLDAAGWTVVYQKDETVNSTGWRTFEFQTPFEYNGTDNLLVDFSHNNNSYTENGNCRASSPRGLRSAFANSDSGYGDPLSWSGSTSPLVSCSDYIPNVKLTIYRENIDSAIKLITPD